MSKWRPINSAPKDGTRIMLFGPGGVYIGRWLEEANFGENNKRPGWQIFDCEMDEFYAVASDDATHWMPLPLLPEVTP